MEKPASVCLLWHSSSPAVVCVTRGRELPLERAHQCSRDLLGRDLPPPAWEKPQTRECLDLEALSELLSMELQILPQHSPALPSVPRDAMAHGCSLGFVLGRGGFASNIPFRKAAADPEKEIFTCSAFPRNPQAQSSFKSECQALIHLL